MTDARRRVILTVGGFLTVAIVVAGVLLLLPDDPPSQAAADGGEAAAEVSAVEVADRFLDAFAAGDAAAAGALTDDSAAATKQLGDVWRGLAPQSVSTTITQLVEPVADAATATVEQQFTIAWTLGANRTWSYDSTLPLIKDDGSWRVDWTPALVHPKLGVGQSLAVRGQVGQVAVLDRDGGPLLTWGPTGPTAADPAIAPLLLPAMGRVAAERGGNDNWHVALVDAAGTELASLHGSQAGPAKPITSTLSRTVQAAAQRGVDSVAQPAMLVAIQPSTGDILAVAQNAAAGGDPKALHGLYPPGSTFKIATATAVLGAGRADLNTVLPCPGRATIGTRLIKNADFELGDVPLRTAFAQSCNTTFAALAAELPPDALPAAAGRLGLNADFDIPGITTEAGGVNPAGGTPEQVENGIGQGTVQASPFGVALMAATVAASRAVTPRLWRDIETTVNAGYEAPPAAVIGPLRTMLREVVTSGRAKALARRGAVSGKTGTAQFGDGTHAHGWFAGFRGDLAFAVLVEGAETAAPAVAVSGTFLAPA